MEREFFVEVRGAGNGTSVFPIGPPEGVVPGRAFRLVQEEDAWDVEFLLAANGLPWDRSRAEPRQG